MGDLSTLLALLATFHFTCTAPRVEVVADITLGPYLAVYARDVEQRNLIYIRDTTARSPMFREVLMHELLHCGLYEERVKHGRPPLPNFDPQEEQMVQALTTIAMERL